MSLQPCLSCTFCACSTQNVFLLPIQVVQWCLKRAKGSRTQCEAWSWHGLVVCCESGFFWKLLGDTKTFTYSYLKISISPAFAPPLFFSTGVRKSRLLKSRVGPKLFERKLKIHEEFYGCCELKQSLNNNFSCSVFVLCSIHLIVYDSTFIGNAETVLSSRTCLVYRICLFITLNEAYRNLT